MTSHRHESDCRELSWSLVHLTQRSVHLAHLSQVDCQYGSGPKPFQNNNLQFDAGLFSPHLAHFVHTQAKEIVEKTSELVST